MPVRGTKEGGANESIGIQRVIQEFSGSSEPPLQVVEGVIPNLVPFSNKLIEKVGILAHVIAHAKEGGFTLKVSSTSSTHGVTSGMGPSSKVSTRFLMRNFDAPKSPRVEGSI